MLRTTPSHESPSLPEPPPAHPADPAGVAPEAHDRRALIGAATAAIAGVAAVAAHTRAGPVDPPPGPVAPTGKTISQIEPRTAINAANTPGDATAVFRITRPGAYYLTGNVDVPAGKAGILVGAGGVRIDLCGFRLSGNDAPGSVGITDGGAALADVAVRNGTIVSMGGQGIALTLTRRAAVADVTLRGNAGVGLHLGDHASVTGVFAEANASGASPALAAGIRVGEGSAVRRCIARGNAGTGIAAGAGCTVEACISTGSAASGITALAGSDILRCVSSGNASSGIVGGSRIASCAVSSNTLRGIETAEAAIDGCSARANKAAGIAAGGHSTLSGCVAALGVAPEFSFVAHGFDLGVGSVISESVAYSNQGAGILASRDARITRCVVRGSSGEGIFSPQGGSFIADNSCSVNSAGNIVVQGSGSRIEGNFCTGSSTYGIFVNGAGNTAVRSACSSNQTNWGIQSNNAYGPVVNRIGISVSGMVGHGTVASTLNTTDPYANFSI